MAYACKSVIAQLLKNPPAMQETPVGFLGQEDPVEKGLGYPLQYSWVSLAAQTVKNLPAMQETWVRSWVGKGHGHPLQRVAERGRKKSDTTEQLSIAQSSVRSPLPGGVKYKMRPHVVTDRN